MEHTKNSFSMRRLTCFLLALVMIVSLFPGVPHAHAAEAPSLVITNAEGEETDTFVVGEPIYVTANSTAGDWVAMYTEKSADGESYWFWYYVDYANYTNADYPDMSWTWENGETYNIYDTVCYKYQYEGDVLPAGKYEIRLENNTSVTKTITLVEPESTESALAIQEEDVTAGEPFQVTATSYYDYAWVGLYSGTHNGPVSPSMDYYYTNGHNGLPMEFTVFSEGEYTLILYTDYNGTTVDKIVHFTAKAPEVELPPILTTDKTEYKFGEPIIVTVNGSAYASTAKDWVGLYKKGESYNPDAGGVKSIYWYYISERGSVVDINWRTNPAVRNENSRDGEFVAGEYTIALLANDGYSAVTTVDITITKEESSRVVKDPSCEEAGSITITYTDGTTETIPGEPATGHAYGDWAYDAAAKQHVKTCANDEAHVVTENCTFDEGAVTKEPTETETGVKTFTCTVCSGTYTEEIPATGAVETGRETVAPTCTEDGYTLITYSDGTTEKVDIVPALGHDWSDWTHVDLTRTHIRACRRENCEVTETENCVLEHESVSGSQLKYTCSVCGDYAEDILWTDKAEYESGEDIIVTVNPNYAFGSTDWIGLYKAGEAPSPTGVTSIRWDYVEKFEGGMNIFLTNWHDRPTEDVDNRLTAGEYWLYLCKNDSYETMTHISFNVTAKEVSRETTPPTCEEDGYVTAYYSDGTSKVVVTAEEDPSLKATGHTWGDWVYDGEEKQTHTHTCTVCEEDTETEACQWDEGVVTKEATETEDGIMTFTCTVCGGTKTKAISTKVVDRTETVEATCEEAGYIRTWYTDGTYTDEILPPKGHAYGEWIFDSEAHTHTKTCANDASHTVTENCSFDVVVSGNSATHTCTVCGGSYSTGILNTNKTNYTHGEEIIVTIFADVGPDAWVGLYGKGESANPNMGNGRVSYYWCWASDKVGTPFNMLADGHYNTDRGETLGSGEYVLRLFADSGYDNIVAEVEITIIKAEVSRTVVEPTCDEEGYTLVTYTDGSTEKVDIVPALGHAYGDWTCNNDGKSHSKVCANDASHVITENCTWDEGVVTKEPSTEESGVRTYTCSVCEGTKEEIIPALTVEEVKRETVAPTCTEDGYTLVTYSDGTTQKIDIVPALGHDWGDWTHVERTRTHTHQCKREDCGVTETEDCVLEYEGLRGSQVECNCRTCGDYFEDLFWTDKAEYESGEDIIVTVNPNYDFGSTDWIGLYKAGEAPSPTGVTSIRWDYVEKFEGGMNIFLSNWHDRPTEDVDNRLTAGEYWLYLCKNDGYEIVTHISFNVTAVEVSRETTPPTCEEDGYVTAYYSDGTSKVVVTAEEDPSLKATGHTWGDWVYDGEEKQTHTHTCTVCEEDTETEACQWDEGVVTKEATETEDGLMTFTCTVCGGTKTKVISTKTVDHTETVEATCEEAGYIRTWYTDGTYTDELLPPKGHAYGEWVFDSQTRSHTKTCANDASHTVTEDCSFDVVVSGNSATYTCSVCDGSYVTGLLNTNKTTYALGEEIIVTVLADVGPDAWVGLYGKGEAANPNVGNGRVSYYWCWTSDKVGTPFNMLADGHYNTDRNEALANGEYVLRLFADSGYDNIVAEVEITIFTDISGNEYKLKVNGEFAEDGTELSFLVGEEVIVIPVVEGEIGYGWMGIYSAKYNCDTVFSPSTPSDWYAYFTDVNNQTVSLNTAVDFGPGDYTVVLFADGGYGSPQLAVNFRVRKAVVSYEVLREATCTIPGSAKILYEGDTEYTFEPIPALGHDWSFNAETKSHVCQREACGISEPCEFSTVTDEEGNVTHTCSVCHGTYTEEKEPDDEEEETEGALLRLAGANRVLTSLQAADMLMKELNVEKLDAVILASAMNFPDALSGSYLAAVKNAPILLTAKGYEEPVNAFITENLAEGGTVYVLGGEAAVPAALLEGLTGVQRVAGETRFETNLEILKEAGITGNEILVCTALNFPDSLSAAAVGKPILLVGSKLTAEQEAYLQLLGEKNFYIIGGTSAISKSVEYALQSYGGTIRIAGENRYDTSALIAQRFFPEAEAVVLAYGRNYPDGLCGGALAAAMGAPVILVEDAFIDHAVDYVQGKEIQSGYVLGGTGLLSDASVRTIWALAEDAEIAVYSK